MTGAHGGVPLRDEQRVRLRAGGSSPPRQPRRQDSGQGKQLKCLNQFPILILYCHAQVFLPDAAKYPSCVETELRLYRLTGGKVGLCNACTIYITSILSTGGVLPRAAAEHHGGPDRGGAGGSGDVVPGALPALAPGSHQVGPGQYTPIPWSFFNI